MIGMEEEGKEYKAAQGKLRQEKVNYTWGKCIIQGSRWCLGFGWEHNVGKSWKGSLRLDSERQVSS